MSNNLSESREQLASDVKQKAQFFEVDIVIRIFGVEILHLHFPPKTN